MGGYCHRDEEGYDAGVDTFFKLDVRHTALFVHPDRARPDLLLRATKSAACVQSVGQKLKSDLFPLLGRRARWQLEVQRYTLACSAATKYSCADEQQFCRGPACRRKGGIVKRHGRPAARSRVAPVES